MQSGQRTQSCPGEKEVISCSDYVARKKRIRIIFQVFSTKEVEKNGTYNLLKYTFLEIWWISIASG